MTDSDETIARDKVAKIADNLQSSAEDILKLISADDLDIEKLLETTRFMARSARRIARRANWAVGTPAPGNELKSGSGERRPRADDRPRSRTAPRRSEGDAGRRDSGREGGGGSRSRSSSGGTAGGARGGSRGGTGGGRR